METTIKPSPCPCCGNSKLILGNIDQYHLGVVCDRKKGCGLTMAVCWPDKNQINNITIDEIEMWCQLEAIKRWNRRQQQIIPTSLLNDIQAFNDELGKLVKTSKKKKVKK